jgi:hypothetical protein
VPWASDRSINFLISLDDAKSLLKNTSFIEIIWEDKTASALEWLHQMTKRYQSTDESSPSPPIGIHTIVGPQWQTMVENLVKNYEEEFIMLVQGIFERRRT